MAYQYAEARRGDGVAVGVCALSVVLGVVAHGVKVVRVVGDGVAVVVRPDAVRVWLLMGVRLLRSGRGCAHLPGLKRSARVGLCTSLAPYIYI